MISMLMLSVIFGLLAGGVAWFAWGLLENIRAFIARRRWERANLENVPEDGPDREPMEPEDVDAA